MSAMSALVSTCLRRHNCLTVISKHYVFQALRPISAVNKNKSIFDNTKSIAENVVACCPERVQPYLRLMRVDKPIGKA